MLNLTRTEQPALNSSHDRIRVRFPMKLGTNKAVRLTQEVKAAG